MPLLRMCCKSGYANHKAACTRRLRGVLGTQGASMSREPRMPERDRRALESASWLLVFVVTDDASINRRSRKQQERIDQW